MFLKKTTLLSAPTHKSHACHTQDKDAAVNDSTVELSLRLHGHEAHCQLGLGQHADTDAKDDRGVNRQPDRGRKIGPLCPAYHPTFLESFRIVLDHIGKGLVRGNEPAGTWSYVAMTESCHDDEHNTALERIGVHHRLDPSGEHVCCNEEGTAEHRHEVVDPEIDFHQPCQSDEHRAGVNG